MLSYSRIWAIEEFINVNDTTKGGEYVRIHGEIDQGHPSAPEGVCPAQGSPNFHEISQSVLSGDSPLILVVMKCKQFLVLARASA